MPDDRSPVPTGPAPALAFDSLDLLAQRLRHDAAGTRPVFGPLGQQRQDQRLELVRDAADCATRGRSGAAESCCDMIDTDGPVNGTPPVADS